MRFKVGDKVIVGRHDATAILGEYKSWNMNMEQYVGKVATLTRQKESYEAWYIDLDGGLYFYYEKNMKPPINNENQKCAECNVSAPHENPNTDGKYICVWCKTSLELV